MKTIPPFGVEAAALPIVNVPLAEAVRSELAGLDASRLAIGPGVFLNAACARALLEAGKPGRLRLRAPGWAKVAGGKDVRDLDVVVDGGKDPIEIDADERPIAMGQGPEDWSVAAPRLVAARIGSWADLLWTNLFQLTARMRALGPAKGAGLVTLAILRARSLNKWRVAGKLVETGKGCDVHPTAVVEASVLGPGVKVGPGAVVRGSVLAEGVEVEELALVVGSVIGAQSRIQRQSMLKFSVVGKKASSGGTVQLSVFGDGSSIRGGSYTLDRRLDGTPVKVMGADGLVTSGPALGIALGPGASVGSGVWIAPGRLVPAGCVVVRAERDTVSRVPPDLAPGVYEANGGGLVRIGK